MLLLGGDLCPDGSPQQQADWLDSNFRRWLKETPARNIVAVAGNHDFVFQLRPDLVPPLNWTYLQDNGAEIDGIRIWGTPWQPIFFDWAFNLAEPELETKWRLIPERTDILVLHGPPYRHGDRNSKGEHTGSPSLLTRIREIQPKLVICGHIHEARGEYRVAGSRILNVSQLDLRYQPVTGLFETEWQA
ncbi:MAG: metallophosphoesterase [Gemmatales bacterium]